MLIRHGFRRAAVPMLTLMGFLLPGLVGGSVIVETIFGWPGVGKLMIDAVIQRDFAVVQAAVLVTALAIFTMNVLIDIAYSAVDPRVRLK